MKGAKLNIEIKGKSDYIGIFRLKKAIVSEYNVSLLF